jgi:hypothetical protein
MFDVLGKNCSELFICFVCGEILCCLMCFWTFVSIELKRYCLGHAKYRFIVTSVNLFYFKQIIE